MKNLVEILITVVIAICSVVILSTTCSTSTAPHSVITVVTDTVWRVDTVIVNRAPIAFTARAQRVEYSDLVTTDTTIATPAGDSSRVRILERTQIASIDTSLFGHRIGIGYSTRSRLFTFSELFPPDTLSIRAPQINRATTITVERPRPWYEVPAYISGGVIVGVVVAILAGVGR